MIEQLSQLALVQLGCCCELHGQGLFHEDGQAIVMDFSGHDAQERSRIAHQEDRQDFPFHLAVRPRPAHGRQDARKPGRRPTLQLPSSKLQGEEAASTHGKDLQQVCAEVGQGRLGFPHGTEWLYPLTASCLGIGFAGGVMGHQRTGVQALAFRPGLEGLAG